MTEGPAEKLINRLEDVVNDKTSGSNQLYLNVLEASLEYFSSEDASVFDKDIKTTVLGHLEQLTQFAVIDHFINQLGNKDFTSKPEMIRWLEEEKRSKLELPGRVAQSVQNLVSIEKSSLHILVLSNSFTVSQALVELAEQTKLVIYQAESRPAGEGTIQANFLAGNDIKVTLFADALIPRFVKISDFVLLGADAIYPAGFVNKIGSLSAAIAADEFQKPLYVAADPSKVVTGQPDQESNHPSHEIADKMDQNVKVVNLYFELVAHHYVTNYILGEQIKTPLDLF